MAAQVLLADDDASLRFVLSQALNKEGYAVRATASVSTLAKWVKDGEGDIVLSDVYMGDDCLFDALPTMREARPNLPIIVMSAQSTVATAFSAVGSGAYDYVPKPFDLEALIHAVRRALASGPKPKSRSDSKKAERDQRLPLIGRSAAMQEVYKIASRVAPTDLTILLEGECGVGKERVARTIHQYSRRADRVFYAATVAGLSAAQVDQELFGPDGAFKRAHGGTLYLEDIDELPSDGQTRFTGLLHSDRGFPRDVRLIVASQRNLHGLARRGAIRQDLLHHLNVVPVRIPPLRERMDDISDLAHAFLIRIKSEGLPEKALDASALERLKAHDFPGNLRELENLLRRAAALTPEAVITGREISRQLEQGAPAPEAAPTERQALREALLERLTREFDGAKPALPTPGLYDRLLEEIERPLIEETLRATGGNQIRAASVLGLNRNTLRKKIVGLGLRTG
jgi:two-component system nitrogen regulation response regulator GlnG